MSKKRIIYNVVGAIIIIVGLVFAIIGFVDFFKCIGTYETPKRFWCSFVGMPLFMVGLAIVLISNIGAIGRRTMATMAPIAKDTLNYMMDDKETVFCPKCGAMNTKDSNYCKACGQKLDK